MVRTAREYGIVVTGLIGVHWTCFYGDFQLLSVYYLLFLFYIVYDVLVILNEKVGFNT